MSHQSTYIKKKKEAVVEIFPHECWIFSSVLFFFFFFSPSPSFVLLSCLDQKPLSVEVGEASTLRLLGAEQENMELKRRLEELQAQQEVRAFTLRAGIVCNGLTSDPRHLKCIIETPLK